MYPTKRSNINAEDDIDYNCEMKQDGVGIKKIAPGLSLGSR